MLEVKTVFVAQMNRTGIGFLLCPWLTKEGVTNVQLLRQKDRSFSIIYGPRNIE